MSFLKKMVVPMLMGLLLVMTASAFAGGPVDPNRERMKAFKQEEQRYLRRMEKAAADGVYYGSNGVTISVSGKKQPTETLTFTATIPAVQDVSGYTFRWGISDEGRGSSEYIYYPQNDEEAILGKTKIQYCFYSAGTYSCFVTVYKGDDQVGMEYIKFTIEDDGIHPTMEQKAQEIVDGCRGDSKWQTALNLYDWLTHHAYYDASLEYHGEDILFTGYGVCDSYSKAYELLCRTAGIPAERTFAPGHAWNTLQIDGEWYQADATWDDIGNWLPGEGELIGGEEGHAFFCVNAEGMRGVNAHHYDDGHQKGEHAASCTSMDANYYIHEGLWRSFGEPTWGNFNEETMTWEEDVHSYVNRIEDTFRAGQLSFETALYNNQYYRDQNGNIRDDYIESSVLKEILKAGLSKSSFSLGNDKVTVRADVGADLVLSVKLAGWDIEESGALAVPEQTSAVNESAFEKIAATTLAVPDGCRTIGARAFADSAIRTVVLPASVETIADDAFSGCGRIILVTDNETAITYAKEHDMLVAEP